MREGPPANRAAWSRTVLDFLGGAKLGPPRGG
jgi:hypothetical protein